MNQFRDILISKNLSVTQARLDMLTTLSRIHEPCTIEQLGKLLTKPVHTTTLYRSLKTLVDAGIVYQTDFRDGAAYFEFQGEDHHHHHLTCTLCKRRITINVCIDHFIPALEKDSGYLVTGHLLELFGICPQCKTVL